MKHALTTLAILSLAACTPDETPTPDMGSPGFDLTETFDDMPQDMPQDVALVDAGEDLPEEDLAGEDLPEEMSGEDMGVEDMGEEDMAEDMSMTVTIGGDRPAEVTLPAGYDGSRDLPLVLALHGYGGNKDSVGRYFSLKRNVDARDFILVSPQGTRDRIGTRFWNATPGCCDGFDAGVDDAGYLRGLILEALERFSIDRDKIFVAGYSNGGFMAYRMACESADYVAGIFVLAGASFKDVTACQPSRPVQILHLHGTADATIAYDGGKAFPTLGEHPGALESIGNWAMYNGCQPGPGPLDATEVDAVTVETATVTGFGGCPADGQVELWTLPDAPHNPGLPQTMGEYILDRFFAVERAP